MKKKLAVIAAICFAFAAAVFAAPQPATILLWKGRYLSNNLGPNAEEFYSYVQNLNGMERYDITSQQWKGSDELSYRRNVHTWAYREAANTEEWVPTAQVAIDFELQEGVIVYKHTTIEHYPQNVAMGSFNAFSGSFSESYVWGEETWNRWSNASFMLKCVNNSGASQAAVVTVTPTGLPPIWQYWDKFKTHYILPANSIRYIVPIWSTFYSADPIEEWTRWGQIDGYWPDLRQLGLVGRSTHLSWPDPLLNVEGKIVSAGITLPNDLSIYIGIESPFSVYNRERATKTAALFKPGSGCPSTGRSLTKTQASKSRNAMKTKRIHNGREVLAHESRDGAKTFANRAQAVKAAASAGRCWEVIRPGRPFYVARKEGEALAEALDSIIADARRAGKDAHGVGQTCTPALCPFTLPLVAEAGEGNALAVLKAWREGWHRANLDSNHAFLKVEVPDMRFVELAERLSGKPFTRAEAAGIAYAAGFAYYIGGSHVAVHARKEGTHNEIEGQRLALITGIGSDWN